MPMKPAGEDQGQGSVDQNPKNDVLIGFHFKRPNKYRKKNIQIDGLSIESMF